MKSVKDLYEEIIESEELKQKLEEAVKEKRVEDFLREQGCDATLDELEAFFKETQEKAGELSDAEPDSKWLTYITKDEQSPGVTPPGRAFCRLF